MLTFPIALQLAVAFGLLNVWLIRFSRRTAYRGGNAASMREEFAAYGLPEWSMYAIGGLKVGAACVLIAAVWFPALAAPAAMLVSILMLGALFMHLKVRDPFMKSVPATAVLAMCLGIIVTTTR